MKTFPHFKNGENKMLKNLEIGRVKNLKSTGALKPADYQRMNFQHTLIKTIAANRIIF
jgi:hypothetical protein